MIIFYPNIIFIDICSHKNYNANSLNSVSNKISTAADLESNDNHYTTASNRLGIVFLLTDGAIKNEREICNYAKSLKNVRLHLSAIII